MMMEKQVSHLQLAINQIFLWFVLMVTSVCGSPREISRGDFVTDVPVFISRGENRTSLIGEGENSVRNLPIPTLTQRRRGATD